MNTILSVLGQAMLVLATLAVVQAVVLLVLFEAYLIIRLGGRLHLAVSAADQASTGPKPDRGRQGGA